MARASALFGRLEKKIHVNFPLNAQQSEGVLRYAGPQAPYIALGKKGTRNIWEGLFYEATEPVNQ